MKNQNIPALLIDVFKTNPLQIAIIFGVIFFLFSKSSTKKKEEKERYEPELPNAGSGIPVVGKDQTGAPILWDEKPLVNELFSALDGMFTQAVTKEYIFQKLMALSPDQLAKVYGTFNKTYYSLGKGTMTDWINDEWNVVFVGSTQPALLAKLRNAGHK